MSAVQLFQDEADLSSRVAARIKALRGLFELSQSDIAKALGVAQPQISNRLRGAQPFSLADIETLAKYFGTTPGYLLGYEEGPAPKGPGQLRTRRDSNPKPSDPDIPPSHSQLARSNWDQLTPNRDQLTPNRVYALAS